MAGALEAPGGRDRKQDEDAGLAEVEGEEGGVESGGDGKAEGRRAAVWREEQHGGYQCRCAESGPGEVGGVVGQGREGRRQPGHRWGVEEGFVRAADGLDRRGLQRGFVEVLPAFAQADLGGGVIEAEVAAVEVVFQKQRVAHEVGEDGGEDDGRNGEPSRVFPAHRVPGF